MTFATLAVLAALAVLVVLAGLLVSLQRRVRRLAAEVLSLREASTTVVTGPAARSALVTPESPAVEPSVAVITRLRDEGEREERAGAELTPGRVVSVTLAAPIIKVAAFSHGLRRALDEEHRMRIGYAFRKELRRQRRLRRKGAATGPGQREGFRP